MNQVLTQSEVDALLSAVVDGSVESTPGAAADPVAAFGGGAPEGLSGGDGATVAGAFGADLEVTPYDLTNQDRVIRGRMPTLDIIYERFIRLYRMSLSNSLRKIATISIISTDLLKFGEFVNTLPIPSCMCIMRFESLHGPALLVFESKLAYALVDSFFGGTDRPYTKIEGKEFTRIELSIMRKVMDLAIRDLEEAWAPVHKADISFLRTEVNPQFVGVVPPSDVIISTTFEVELENASGTIALVIPYSTIEPIKNKLNASFQTESDRVDKEWTAKMEEHLRNTEADIRVNLGSANITVGDLVNLSVGDIIPLSQNADGELDILVEGVGKFKSVFGISRGNRAVQITRVPDSE
ncbi:MAG TPA: flagellar motor switch protein FliM [Bdellovibrionales bacterium]|nr:MAG: flagellar motor switch protein FliM [Bdellovibrionales bacterium GWB1_52_6]OFZ04796.1 MAG: flagellar motor switch protein FliM [Bdellovibrionales bacterium GWA1_52_35]OFZ42812.1 MAG: flagellar motor switch protein FliM [Bdellovibrionales bacterium GWC1_52_8]HAR41901.1 flagellar motor switch protein FliM [Bdellovibrionales bacterium]HCM39616.1 flagellar motor switch protein FliM [Bdellovibrionales bacterium]